MEVTTRTESVSRPVGIGALLCVVLLWSSGAFAQTVTKVGTTAGKFLSIPVGPRALGMGGAFVSIADDATSMYWNAGGTAKLRGAELVMAHTLWLADIKLNYVGLVVPMGRMGNVGLNVTALTMDEMEVTTEEQPEGSGASFSAGSFALGVTYARNLTDWFSIGANLKFVSEHIWNSSATGVAVDLGTLFTTPFRGIRLGASISNFGSKMQVSGDDLLVQKDIDAQRQGNNPNINARLSTDEFDLPLLLRIGISADLVNTEEQKLTVAVDGAHPNDNDEYVNVGGEYEVLNRMVVLRGGYKSLFTRDSEEEFTVGGGIRYEPTGRLGVRVDYAYESFQRFDGVHKFSILLAF